MLTAHHIALRPFHARHLQHRQRIAGPRRPLPRCAAPNWNPQNVDQPKVLPTPDFTPEQAVRVQLDALMDNDQPWPNHGLQTAYEFGEDIGGLDPSVYFGFRKDLYHFDHFMGQFQAKLPQLMDVARYEVVSVGPEQGGEVEVLVDVETSVGERGTYRFVMKARGAADGGRCALSAHAQEKDVGRKKGSWMTKRLTAA